MSIAVSASRIRRWWAFPTRLLILAAVAWWVVPWLWQRVPHAIEYVIARNTPGELVTSPACSFALFPQRLTARNLHWQHQEHDGLPSRVDLSGVTAKLSLWELLFRRVQVDYAALDGVVVEWNNPLQIRWAKHLLGNTDGRSLGIAATSEAARPILREEFVFLLSGRPDMIAPLVAEQFRSHAVAESLKQKWLPEWNALRQRGEALASRWNRLRERLTGTTIPEAIDEGGKLLLELNELVTEFDRLTAQSGGDLQQLQTALREDRRKLESLVPPAMSWDAAIRQIFGEEWLQSVEKTLAQTTTNKTTLPQTLPPIILPPTLPPISVDRLDATGEVRLAGEPVYFRAMLRNGVVPSKRRLTQGVPMVLQCCLDTSNIPDAAAAAVTATDTTDNTSSPLYVTFISDNTVSPPVEKLTLQQPRYLLPELSLGDEQTLKITVAPMTISLDTTLERCGDTASLVVRFFSDNARITPHLPPQVLASDAGKDFEESLAAVRQLSGELRIETVLGENNTVAVKTSFKSNLTDAIATIVDSVMKSQWGTLKQSLSTWLDDTATAAIADANPRDVSDRLGQLRGQLGTALQPFGARDALNSIFRLAPGLIQNSEPLVPLK